jgi:hypothetical protein
VGHRGVRWLGTHGPGPVAPERGHGAAIDGHNGGEAVEDSKLGKVDCFRIEGDFVEDTPMTIWIDKKTFLVRRIDSQKKFDAFRTEETTSYDPVFDGEIPDKKLEFDPPKR